MAWIDPAQLEAQLNEMVTQGQNFVNTTTAQAQKSFDIDTYLRWLIKKHKNENDTALSQEAQTRTINDTSLSDRIDALMNSAGAYKATLIYELTAADATGSTSLQDLFAAGMVARNLTVIPNAEYRIVFSQKDAIADIVEKTITYINFAGEASTASASPAESFILKTDAAGLVENGAIQENPFKRELDAIKVVVKKTTDSMIALGQIFKTGFESMATIAGKVASDAAAWAIKDGYTFPTGN